jgi:hypothetical protein
MPVAYPGEATNRNSLDFMVVSSAISRRGGAYCLPRVSNNLILSELFCHLSLIFISLIYVFGLWSLIFDLLIAIRDIRA